MTTVLCVLKVGGDFHVEHVHRLREQVFTHSDAPFVCLTDDVSLLDEATHWTRPLAHNWPGWWSKMEALTVPGPCLYVDLDVTIQNSMIPMLEVVPEHEFIICRDFWEGGPHEVNSSVMAWRGSAPLECVTKFALHAPERIEEYTTKRKWGDQAYLRDYGPARALWQDLVPGSVASTKGKRWSGPLPTEDTIIAVSSGYPRPWEVGN